MKKLTLALLITVIGAGFVAGCDDDNDKTNKPAAECKETADCGDATKVCRSGKCEAIDPVTTPCTEETASTVCPSDKPLCISGACSPAEPECTDENAAAKCPAEKPYCVSGACSATKAPECIQNSECPSDKPNCSAGVCTAATADNPECNAQDAASCPSDKPYCVEGVCRADNPECTKDSDCSSDKPLCKGGVCTAKPVVACENGTCSDGYCIDNACIKANDACSDKTKAQCFDNVLVKCAPDAWDLDDGETPTEKLIWQVTNCDSKVCAVIDSEAACFEKCENENSEKYMCDASSAIDEDNDPKDAMTFTCKKHDASLFFIKTKTETCEKDCNPSTGKCYSDDDVAGSAENGPCESDTDCKLQLYCDSELKTCQKIHYFEEACTKDEQCNTDYCDPETKKCIDKPAVQTQFENGHACEVSSDCISKYCSLEKVCADEPVVSDGLVECVDKSSCKADEICSANFKCEKSDKLGLGDECSDDAKCAAGMKCLQSGSKKACLLETFEKATQKCNSAKPACDGNVLLECGSSDSYSTGDETYTVTLCPTSSKLTQTCVASDKVSAKCAELCEEVGNVKTTCWDGDTEYTEHTCTQVGDKKVYLTQTKSCEGMMTCDYATGKCSF